MGFILSAEGIKPDPDRVKSLKEIPKPKNRQEMQSVLGAFGYYSRFVQKYANYIEPFRDLLSQKNKFCWTQKHDVEFKKLK